MKIFAAVDIGGTAIKYGTVSETGEVLSSYQTPTEAEKGGKALVKKVIVLIDTLINDNKDIAGIGISTAGVVDSKKGEVLFANENLPGYIGTQWKKILEDRYHLGVCVNNDVNAAALAEAWIGAAKGEKNFFCTTVGTGVGGAIIINGKLHEGANFRAAEIGYLNTTGAAGWYEKKASTSALVRNLKERTGDDDVDGKVAFIRARQKVGDYEKILDEWVEELAKGFANIIYLFDPGLIVIGGGVSKERDYFMDKIMKCLSKYTMESFLKGTHIKPAECGNNAGMIGAVSGFVMNK